MAVEGKFIRVHYKVRDQRCWLCVVDGAHDVFVPVFVTQGESTNDDEWLSVNSRDLRRRIVAVEPPPPKSSKESVIYG